MERARTGQTKVRHRRSTAHERARYRCFLPDLAGLAGKRRAEPMPDTTYYQEIAENRNGHNSWRRNLAVETRLAASRRRQHSEFFNYHQAMADSECAIFKKLKDRETRAHAAWTSFLYRNEHKPKLSEKAKRKHQKEEMEAYEQAHKARLAHVKTCLTCGRSAPAGI
jgi:hypothetical protein